MACLVAVLASQAWAQPALRMARIEDAPDQFVGAEILKVVYGRLHIPIQFVDVPAKRALVDSSSGVLDGEVQRSRFIEADHPSLIRVATPINYLEPTAFTKQTHIAVAGWQSLRAYRIGIVRGVVTSEEGTRGMPQLLAVTSLGQLLQALNADRIDVAVADAFAGGVVLQQLGLTNQVRALAPPLQRVELYHYIHCDHRELVPQVDRVLKQMAASGELDSLRTQMIRTDLSLQQKQANPK